MQKRFLVILLSFTFLLAFSVDAEAQSRKKKKGKQRPAKTEEVEEQSSSERSKRTSEGSEDSGEFFTMDKLVYDIMGDFRIGRAGSATVLKFGLKPAVSFKVWPRISFGVAPKIEYYFTNLVDREDLNEFDLGIETFGRVLVFESVYLQLGYDFNNYLYYLNERTWINSPVIGGGYMSGFGKWRYGAQALFMLNEERRDYNSPIELWFGLTYNL